ncbi:hypothetical protein SLS64_007805 [Diaporthe eres]
MDLPALATEITQTSGIWAPTIRYRGDTFYVTTTLVDDAKNTSDTSRWDNVIFTTGNPYDSSSWSDPTHFDFDGYDPGLFWDDDGQAYVVGAHPWQIRPGIDLAPLNLETGEIGKQETVWNGTGGVAPEGPRAFKKDGYYYLVIAEGGTYLDHMATIARSKTPMGPYEPNPANPFLTNANTTEYFQAVGHADLFPDANGNWWGVALAMRADLINFAVPMGRETVLYPIRWTSEGWPVASQVRGVMSGWSLPAPIPSPIPNKASVSAPDIVDFPPGSAIPAHFIHQRFPDNDSYVVSPTGHENTLRLTPSTQNLTGQSGIVPPKGPTFLARRQTDTLFSFSAVFDFQAKQPGEEIGVTLYVSQDDHVDLGLVLISDETTNATSSSLKPYFRLRGQSEVTNIEETLVAVPDEWSQRSTRMQIKSINGTHYAFSAAPSQHQSQEQTIAYISASSLRTTFTGEEKTWTPRSTSLLTERQVHWSGYILLPTGEMEAHQFTSVNGDTMARDNFATRSHTWRLHNCVEYNLETVSSCE